MSDIHIINNFTNIPDSDTLWNSFITLQCFDSDGERISLGYAQPPAAGVMSSTPALRGLYMPAGNTGIISHFASDSDGNLKTVQFVAWLSDTSYDLDDCRIYVQLANKYTVDAQNVVVTVETREDTPQTLATLYNGGTLEAGEELEINFLNDYDASKIQIRVVWEYAGTPVISGFYEVQDGYTYSTGGRSYTLYARGHSSANPGLSTPPDLMIPVYAYQLAGGGVAWLTTDMTAKSICYIYVARTNQYMYIGLTEYGTSLQYTSTLSSTAGLSFYGFQSPGLYDLVAPYVYATVQDAVDAFLNVPSSGLDTSELNTYTGNMWQMRAFADISQTYPGPMSTESEGGKDGDFDISTDTISVPALPAEDTAINPTGHLNLYLMTPAIQSAFFSQLYSSSIATAIRNLWANVTDGVVTLNLFPLPTSAYTTRFSSNIYCGGVDFGSTTATSVIQRYIQYNLGTVNLHLFWDSALDLNPYTKLNIYLPGIGMRPLDADVVMGHDVGLIYNIDILTGNAIAYITLDGDLLDQYAGNIAEHVSITGPDWASTYAGMLSSLATVGNSAISSGGNPMAGVLSTSAAAIVSNKMERQTIGSFGGSFSRLGSLVPYIEILRPIQQLPRDYVNFNAYPSHMTTLLSNLTGYAEVENIFLDDIECTDDERQELADLLRGGVIFG